MQITLEPRNLVMTINCCFYCGANKEEILWKDMEHLFGIKHCSAHTADAKRDCNAYKHREAIVDILDAKEMPLMQPLFANASFTIPRSSGLLEAGWAIKHGCHYAKSFIYKTQEEWAAPLYKGDLVKHVHIRNILNTEEAAQVIVALDAGVYVADAAAAAACTPAIHTLDPSWITRHESGCRVVSINSL